VPARGLSANELRDLVAEHGSLEAARRARPELAGVIAASVRTAKTAVPPLQVVSERPGLTAPDDLRLSEIALRRDGLAVQLGAAPARGGRPEGSYIETDTFWVVWKQVVDGHASGRDIDRDTFASKDLQRVNREKAGVIIKWVEKHPRAAKNALVARKPPRGFSATPFGVRIPDA
jgi:hypothetical protein